MKFTDEQIRLTLFGNIQNETHQRERTIGFLKYLVRNIARAWPSSRRRAPRSEKAILLFSTERFFRLKDLGDYKIICYKEKLPGALALDLRHEEYVLTMCIFLPAMIRRSIFNYVYRRVDMLLRQFDIRCFLCNQPEIINHLIAHYCRANGIMTATMQHGVYMPDFYKPLPYELELSDKVLVWGEVYRQCYHAGGIDLSGITVCSPPMVMSIRKDRRRDVNQFRPVFLGQQLFKIHTGVYHPYNAFLCSLIAFWQQFDIRLSYKPHPREDLNRSLTTDIQAAIKIEPARSVGPAFFSNFDVAYSVNSTSLFHALCADLICLQVDLELTDLPNEWFSKHASISRIGLKLVATHGSLLAAPPERFISPDFLSITADPQKYNSQALLALLS